MKFGRIALSEAEGAILAHSVEAGGRTLKKGTRLTAALVERLAAAGLDGVIAARLAPEDVHEDEAAGRLAAVVAGEGVAVAAPFTGRSNLHASSAGLLVVDRAAIDAFNRIDPAITLATLPEFARVEAGRMVATVKIIPFSVPQASLARAEAAVRAAPPVRIAPFRPMRVGLVATRLPSLKPSVMEKTARITAARLAPAGATLLAERRVPHDAAAVGAALAGLAAEGADLSIVFGASAVVDAEDVIPAGIAAAGGRVIHLGMPVDPGNLLVLGEVAGRPVVGAPGCARSPKENGFDWVLDRLLAGLPVGPDEITGLGVGGLLMEIVSRPQPREERPAPGRRVAAVILAAGLGSRMGGPTKQLATIGGVPLVRRAAEAARASGVDEIVVVLGHRGEAVRAALGGLAVRFADNPDYAAGLSTSLRAGIAALAGGAADGALVMLADMPAISAEVIDRLIAAFDPAAGRMIVLPTAEGRRGNPVLWSRSFFPDLLAIQGDTGARHLIGAHADAVAEVEIGAAAALDIDTPEALAAAGGMLSD
ncbi:NTP transferase domain-containing protein [Prosthecomicrobium pneumaticum]|uniref:Molybdenum cofactor cytidylyltransferase n=1 Tax=Prosthecomicrobium pneumaticum TaxID=81895 RepID=A0A7W9FPF8_9HYPH|nr:molybdenum cofactor cytidylyltransferase [Prosthecomicrobium pneumaticum]